MTDRSRTPPKFIYFDLGNVLFFFDHRRACQQLAAATGAGAGQIWDLLFASGLELEYEAGRLTSRQMHQRFQEGTSTTLEFDAFARAFSEIFEVSVPLKAILAQLAFCGQRMGLLSNTNEMHWQFLLGDRYGLMPDIFEKLVLSYEVGAIKPEAAIFQAAIERAGVAPHEIFYMDDMPGHVAGALSQGIDAVQFTDAVTLAAQMHARGIDLNY